MSLYYVADHCVDKATRTIVTEPTSSITTGPGAQISLWASWDEIVNFYLNGILHVTHLGVPHFEASKIIFGTEARGIFLN